MNCSKSNVVQIGSPDSPRYFTLSEANESLKLVKKITFDSYGELESVKTKLQSLLPSDPRIVFAEKEYEKIVKKWISKMERLGVVVKGLWLIDFDTGDGYLCWKYPEFEISYYHEYTGGFAARKPISDVIEETSPDWA